MPSATCVRRSATDASLGALSRTGRTRWMKLYVCWGTFPVPWPRRGAPWRPSAHPCKRAHDALKEAGHSPEVVRVYSFKSLPDITPGRREVARLTGDSAVPVQIGRAHV